MDEAGPRDQFRIAYHYLHRQLAVGMFTSDERIVIAPIAEQLRISQTPVREALSRLVGEGLVLDRRGQGYYPLPLDAGTIAGLIQLRALYLGAALSGQLPNMLLQKAVAILADDGVPLVDRIDKLFETLLSGAENAMLAAADRRASAQLAFARRVEAEIFDVDFEASAFADSLRSNDRRKLRRSVQAYFKTRERKSYIWSIKVKENIRTI